MQGGHDLECGRGQCDSPQISKQNGHDLECGGNLNEDLQMSSDVVYKLRDRNMRLVTEWQVFFENDIKSEMVQVSHGDIFKGAPSADAIVSPANSFGFMDGGIDMAYSMHFGWQLQKRLQKVIREEHHGEVLVGAAVIIPMFEGGAKQDSMNWKGTNENKPIKYLISAPTMRVPQFVDDTVNSYLAFRAVILAVENFNKCHDDKIQTVLCPGLGTAVGRMPFDRCAFQMKEAYNIFVLGKNQERIHPTRLERVDLDMNTMLKYKRHHDSDEDDDVNEHSLNRRLNIKPPKKN